MNAYRLSIHDNGSHAFYKRADLRRCGTCRELLFKWDEPLTGLVVKNKKRLDLSCTYDGVRVASAAFKEEYEASHLIGLSFLVLPDDPRYFKVTADIVVAFDWQKRHTQFIDRCPSCGRYKSVIGSTPVFLKEGSVVPDNGFARTDLEFASGDEKHPMLLCGLSAGAVLKVANLRGIDLTRI
jgi:hypothetical protein